MKKITMFFIIITIVAAFPVLCYADAKNVEVKEEPQYLETARAVLEQYYKNKDLREKNDFSNLVSKEVCKLLNAKIEMEQFQNEMLDIIYNDYKIEIIPVKIDSWTVGKNRTSMFLQVKRSWIYSENDERTTSSELQNVTVVKKGNSFIAEECYEEYENITLGPIDRVYRESISLKENTDTKIKKYIEDFKRNCLEKKEKQMCDVQEGELITEEERITRVPRVWQALTRADIKTWARSNFDEDNPQSSTSSVPYYDFSEIPGAYDCTNFVSHAILAGGATLHDYDKIPLFLRLSRKKHTIKEKILFWCAV